MLEFKFVKTQNELESALDIRRNVFINEMGVPESIELDELDTLGSPCEHVLVLYNSKPVGTARCNLISDSELKIQRFCFLPQHRKNGFGKRLLEFIEGESILLSLDFEGVCAVHPKGDYHRAYQRGCV